MLVVPPLFTVMPVRDDLDWPQLFEDARRASGLSHKEAAALMGITSQQLSQTLAGQGHPSLKRLDRMTLDPKGQVFFTYVLTHWAAYRGVTDLNLVREWLREATDTFSRLRARMAKAELGHVEQERKRA